MARCRGVKADGTGCERIVSLGDVYCYSHAPERAEERRINAAKAGRGNGPSDDMREIQQFCRELADKVLTGEVDKARASVAATLLGVAIKASEQSRRSREIEELQRQISELDAATRGEIYYGH
jgi:hypothetical protein